MIPVIFFISEIVLRYSKEIRKCICIVSDNSGIGNISIISFSITYFQGKGGVPLHDEAQYLQASSSR